MAVCRGDGSRESEVWDNGSCPIFFLPLLFGIIEERHKKYDELCDYIYSFAKDFGYDDLIEYDKSLNRYLPTLKFDEFVQPIIDENDKRFLGRRLEPVWQQGM
ncbi:hypothetical protein QA612_18035 [Evansella sp. AB-P1]|uniref:hypothetical protein n=1 Tax=Evansella sp. AB-P1 TaxID=3037653 RepID=UPI00241FEA01|nr:hypothetical protein [Evansella sp. AB-P1]MDG5789364.1 hypothetical protein [Evansella sp. AB-P1]